MVIGTSVLQRYNSYYLGHSYSNLGALKEANKHFENHFRLNNKDWQIASLIGWYYGVIRRNDTALEWYLKALLLEPKLLEPHVECARLLAESGRTDEALGHVNQAMDLVETSIEKQMIESLRKKISGDLKGAIQTLERAIAGPNSDWNSAKHFQKADACALLATFQRELGDRKSALSTLESALQSNPNDLSLINELVMEYADQGVRLEEALSLIERALKDQPENPIFIATKGWVLFKLRRREEAKAALERCVELLPECEEAREHLRHITDDR